MGKQLTLRRARSQPRGAADVVVVFTLQLCSLLEKQAEGTERALWHFSPLQVHAGLGEEGKAVLT